MSGTAPNNKKTAREDSPKVPMEKYFSWLFFFFLSLLLILLPLSSLAITVPPSVPPPPPKCHEDERSALLEFKDGLVSPKILYNTRDFNEIFNEVELDPWKLDSWKLDGGDGNCCTWDGVECDPESGHVIGLDLCCTGLHVFINSTRSLFRLVHLQNLNLAYMAIGSPIPSQIGDLPRLRSLILSKCELTGQIPEQVFGLTNLSSLDLSHNDGLELVKPSLEDLALRLTKLEELDLSFVHISSPLPHALTNLSSLTALTLSECGLEGQLPLSVFSMPNLQLLHLGNNFFSGHLPEFHQGSRLQSLYLDNNSLSGELSPSISNLTELIDLSLPSNGFQGPIPSFANMSKLKYLDLGDNTISGGLSSFLENLPQLNLLSLSSNLLIGQIPSQTFNLSQLKHLDLSFNMLSGTVHLEKFLELKNLEVLYLAFNNLSVVNDSNTTISHTSKLIGLKLASCNLRKFPKLLLGLQQLELLDLSSNGICGQVPIWFQSLSRQKLAFLYLSRNSLTGFEGNSINLKWEKLEQLDLSFNFLRGPLPLPPESISLYHASNNRLSGEISPLLCRRRFIQVLDLAMNNFTGAIPQCFSNLTGTLVILNLHNNNLHGRIPQVPDKYECLMRMLDLNNNQLQGQLPRSLSSCTDLEFLNIGNNNIEDTFPSWLGAITHLRVLILRSNRFHGAIEEPKSSSKFQSLQIIDLSWNNFKNYLPAKYFQYWTSMKVSISEDRGHLNGQGRSPASKGYVGYTYDFTLTIMNKGMQMEYEKILGYLQAIDFSGNNFSGEIPESIANLKGLRLLNFSNNNLSGPIPPVLGGLTNMESLDLSGNMLSGEIPQQLTQLNFLAFFNVSNNQLSGPIPRGTQFDTFKNTSYKGNEGLCGVPLSRTCGSVAAAAPASSPDEKEDSNALLEIDWKAVVVGYAAGFVITAVIGHKVIMSRPDWFARALGFVERRRWI